MKLWVGLIVATMVLGGMLLSGVVLAKTIKGGPDADSLTGTNSADYIKGNGGADNIDGKNGMDKIFGGKGNDRLHGGRSDDWVYGDTGSDTAWGDQGEDHLSAEPTSYQGSIRAAKVTGGRKPDKLLGGPGNDTIRAKNGKKDIVRGGPGHDTAYVDPVDTEEGVEDVPNLPPTATIDSGPQTNPPDADGNVEFTFSANETSTFECRLKEPNVPNPTWESCVSPKSYSLADGTYTFELRATDTDGKTSEVAPREFKVLD
jgi:Ca2+-binding RTX toxin-like protein